MNLRFFEPAKIVRLSPQRPPVVVLLASELAHPFFAEITLAVEERLDAAGLITLVDNPSDHGAKEARLFQTLQGFPPRGVLIGPSSSREGALRFSGRVPA